MKKQLLTLFMALIACFGAVAADYVKVTSAPEDWSGEYALVYEGTGNDSCYAFTGIDAIGTAQTPGSTTVTITNGTISNYTGATIVVAALANGGYSVAVKGGTNDGKYISSGSSVPSFTNALKFNSTAHRVDFALTDGAVVMSQTCDKDATTDSIVTMRFNSASNQQRFRFYKSGQKPVQLYKKVEGGSTTPEEPEQPTTYSINIASNIANGTVTASTASAVANAEITLTATPNEGYEFGSWSVKDASDNSITVTNNKFSMPTSNVTVSATFNAVQQGGTDEEGEELDTQNLEYTFDFTINNFNLPTAALKNQEGSYTYDGKTIKVYGDASNGFKYGGSGSHFHLIMGKSGAYLTLPSFDFAVSKIVVVGDSAASSSVVQNIYVGAVAVSTATTGVAQGDGDKLAITNTYLINEDYQAAGNIYTLKVTSAHNTQVTKIYIYKNPNAPTTPTLVVSPESLTLEADATSGEVEYTVTNPDGSTLSAAVNAEATWVSNVAIDSENNKVTFSTTENGRTAAREAVITVTYGSIQKTVTISQKRLVLDYAELPFTIAAGTTGSTLKATDGITCKIDGSDYNNDDYKIKLSGNTHYIQVKTNERIGACTFNFCGLAAEGNSSFKLQESVDGTTWSDIEEFTINFPAKNDVQSWTSTASFSADARYVKLAFKKLRGEVNCGLGEFTISKYVAPASAHGEVSFVATNGDGYWATFSSTQNVIFDANDVVAYTIAVDGDDLVMLDANSNSLACVTDKTKNEGWISGYYVQSGAGVLLYSTETSVNYYYIDTDPYTANRLTNIETNNEYNLLRPASQAKETDGSYLFYKLAYGDADFTPSTLGFYWGADQGGAFTSREGSAYLAVPQSTNQAPARFVFGQTDITTDVESVEAETAVKFFENGQLLIKKNGRVYNAMGQFVR